MYILALTHFRRNSFQSSQCLRNIEIDYKVLNRHNILCTFSEIKLTEKLTSNILSFFFISKEFELDRLFDIELRR